MKVLIIMNWCSLLMQFLGTMSDDKLIKHDILSRYSYLLLVHGLYVHSACVCVCVQLYSISKFKMEESQEELVYSEYDMSESEVDDDEIETVVLNKQRKVDI